MINPNNFATPSAQEQGESLWDGQSMAQQFVSQRSEPTPIPQENGSALNLNGDPIKDNKTNFNYKVPGLQKTVVKDKTNIKKSFPHDHLNKVKNYKEKKDYANHPEVIAHKEHAERTNP
jgi:hypothetical protein|tara:strand:+ start:270 stop:626 length:357 start_codon:yes stop_codon:yes gene_type:complete